MAMTNLDILARADEVWTNRDFWTYCQGGLGELSTSQRIKGLYNYYRGKGNGSSCNYDEWLKLYATNEGKAKQCTDCSNFIQYLLGSGKNAAASYYTNMKACPDIYTAPVGSLLLIPGKHVGLVTKQGIRNADGSWKVQPEQMDFYAYDKPPRRGSYLGSTYSKAVYITGIDYVASDAVPVAMKASVNGLHRLGDTLEAKDFTILVEMSDGTVLKNPSNWSAWPLKLSENVTDIVCKYKNVSCVLKVEFEARIK